MSYSVYLFGLDGDQVAQELSNDNLTERVLSRFREVRSPSASDLAVVSEILAQGLGGNWPDDGTVDPFETFCWVMDALADRFHEIDTLCRGCREEWLEVIESLSDDGLDLLAVLSLW